MLADFVIFLVVKPDLDLERGSEGRIPLLTFLNRILYVVLAQYEIDKLQAQMPAVIFDWGNVVKNLLESLL